ncbi:hypothetical protein Hdeb2414_s0015g00452731 [Helianthus debilis subsp. tardiflorus]
MVIIAYSRGIPHNPDHQKEIGICEDAELDANTTTGITTTILKSCVFSPRIIGRMSRRQPDKSF